MSVISEYTVQERGDQNYFVPNSELDGNTRGCIGIHSASDFPIGTKIIITAIEPEMQIVMPEGMRWIDDYLFDSYGATIAGFFYKKIIKAATGWYHIPFSRETVTILGADTLEELKHKIEKELAKHHYYGIYYKNVSRRGEQLPPTIPTIY